MALNICKGCGNRVSAAALRYIQRVGTIAMKYISLFLLFFAFPTMAQESKNNNYSASYITCLGVNAYNERLHNDPDDQGTHLYNSCDKERDDFIRYGCKNSTDECAKEAFALSFGIYTGTLYTFLKDHQQ